MSWLDKIKNDLIIVTGDGETFKPNWINASKEKEYNVSDFEFIQQSGTLIFRNLPKGRKYNLELYFQGDNCIEDAQKFENSADDPRAWTMKHPFYGNLIVQPIALVFDNSKYNVSKITGVVIETITEDKPKGNVDPVDEINFMKSNMDDVFAQAAFNESFKPTELPPFTNQLTQNVSSAYKLGIPSIKLDLDAEKYFNLFNTANAAAIKIGSDIQGNTLQIQNLFNAPAQFTNSVRVRLNVLTAQFNALRTAITNLLNTGSPLYNKISKKAYENNGAMMISSMAVSSITQMDYNNRADVMASMDLINMNYNLYVTDIDTFQSLNNSTPDSYVADAGSLIALNDLINFTLSNLFDISLNSKQERTLYCEKDTNVILLAHRLYGLLPDDSTIDTLIKNNSIGLLELLQINKGRKIIYYV